MPVEQLLTSHTERTRGARTRSVAGGDRHACAFASITAPYGTDGARRRRRRRPGVGARDDDARTSEPQAPGPSSTWAAASGTRRSGSPSQPLWGDGHRDRLRPWSHRDCPIGLLPTRPRRSCQLHLGEVAEVLRNIHDPVDAVHDDAWFATAPPDLDTMVGVLRPGGLLTMPQLVPARRRAHRHAPKGMGEVRRTHMGGRCSRVRRRGRRPAGPGRVMDHPPTSRRRRQSPLNGATTGGR